MPRKSKNTAAAIETPAVELETPATGTALALIPSEPVIDTTPLDVVISKALGTLPEPSTELVPLEGCIEGVGFMPEPVTIEQPAEQSVEEVVEEILADAAAGVELTAEDIVEMETPDGWVAIEGGTEGTSAWEPVAEPTPPAPEPKTFADLMAAQPQEKVEETVHRIASEIDARAEFERHKAPDNDNIQRTLKKARAALSFPSAARVMLAAAVDPGFVNAAEREGARFNVYAIGKIADLIHVIVGGGAMNAINNACLGSLFAFRAADKTFTHKLALAAASNKVMVEELGVRKLLTRHTVSASTASTQASSTMNALRKLGIVRETRLGSDVAYHLTDAPIVEALAARYA